MTVSRQGRSRRRRQCEAAGRRSRRLPRM